MMNLYPCLVLLLLPLLDGISATNPSLAQGHPYRIDGGASTTTTAGSEAAQDQKRELVASLTRSFYRLQHGGGDGFDDRNLLRRQPQSQQQQLQQQYRQLQEEEAAVDCRFENTVVVRCLDTAEAAASCLECASRYFLTGLTCFNVRDGCEAADLCATSGYDCGKCGNEITVALACGLGCGVQNGDDYGDDEDAILNPVVTDCASSEGLRCPDESGSLIACVLSQATPDTTADEGERDEDGEEERTDPVSDCVECVSRFLLPAEDAHSCPEIGGEACGGLESCSTECGNGNCVGQYMSWLGCSLGCSFDGCGDGDDETGSDNTAGGALPNDFPSSVPTEIGTVFTFECPNELEPLILNEDAIVEEEGNDVGERTFWSNNVIFDTDGIRVGLASGICTVIASTKTAETDSDNAMDSVLPVQSLCMQYFHFDDFIGSTLVMTGTYTYEAGARKALMNKNDRTAGQW